MYTSRFGMPLTVRPIPFVVLWGRFAFDVVVASFQVAWYTVRPQPTTGVAIDMPLRTDNEMLQVLTCELISLVPGTTVIDLDPMTVGGGVTFNF